ncbi:MAG: dihydroorotate dehydrogenase electron transfer subunit [Bacillota bacterium]|jgi:dihydroorotate dehydrogenase electron transfer subunit
MIEQGKILLNEKVGRDIWRMELKCPWIAMKAKPGQFVNVKLNDVAEPLLRRPISLHGIDAENGIISLLYLVVGRGTEMMTKLENGDSVDLLGPLGKGFSTFFHGRRAVIVAGGIGSAPFYPLMEELKAKQKNITMIYGARDAESLTCLDLYEEQGAEMILVTEDGSVGEKGFVTGPLDRLLAERGADFVYACGPEAMLKAVEEVAANHGVQGEVSTEARMGCGLGVCLSCSKKGKDGKNRKVCQDGPVFPMGVMAYE